MRISPVNLLKIHSSFFSTSTQALRISSTLSSMTNLHTHTSCPANHIYSQRSQIPRPECHSEQPAPRSNSDPQTENVVPTYRCDSAATAASPWATPGPLHACRLRDRQSARRLLCCASGRIPCHVHSPRLGIGAEIPRPRGPDRGASQRDSKEARPSLTLDRPNSAIMNHEAKIRCTLGRANVPQRGI